MDTPDLLAGLVSADELSRLEAQLVESVKADDPFLSEVAAHLVAAGGKRVRPALTFAAAGLGGRPAMRSGLLGGVAVELVHLASLYHDDVIDEATRRRNVASVNARWGSCVAIFAGDYLLARSGQIASGLGSEITELLASTLGRLCRGQIAELRSAFQVDRSELDYLAAIADKTAALMAAACRVGGITSGQSAATIEALTVYGESLGMLFQIRDDVLDVISREEQLGKTPGQDLAEGIYTLPVLRAVTDGDIGPQLRPLLGRPLDSETRETARRLVTSSAGIASSAMTARTYADLAVGASSRLGDEPAATALSELARGLLSDLERSAEALSS